MILYWPCAITEEDNFDSFWGPLHTYDPCISLEEAYRVFDVWVNHYGKALKEMWLEVKDGDEKYDIPVKMTFEADVNNRRPITHYDEWMAKKNADKE